MIFALENLYWRRWGTHKWQFDEVQLIEMLESNHFAHVERMPLHQSRIEDIDVVERSDFLIVEGVKERSSNGSILGLSSSQEEE